MELDNHIETYRRLYGWTRWELANKIGMSEPTVLNIERNGTMPKISTVFKIAEVFKVPVGEIYFKKGKPPKLRMPDNFLSE